MVEKGLVRPAGVAFEDFGKTIEDCEIDLITVGLSGGDAKGARHAVI